MNGKVTLLSTNAEFGDDWEVEAVIYSTESRVIELMKEYFKLSCTHKVISRAGLLLLLSFGRNEETCIEQLARWYPRQELLWAEVTDEDVERLYGRVEHKAFLEFLTTKGVEFDNSPAVID